MQVMMRVVIIFRKANCTTFFRHFSHGIEFSLCPSRPKQISRYAVDMRAVLDTSDICITVRTTIS